MSLKSWSRLGKRERGRRGGQRGVAVVQHEQENVKSNVQDQYAAVGGEKGKVVEPLL
jgi:hypothetical protein